MDWQLSLLFGLNSDSVADRLPLRRIASSLRTQHDDPVRQSLSHRLALTAESRHPWPDQPVPIALVITDLEVGGAEHALVMLATRLDAHDGGRPCSASVGPDGLLK